MVQYPATAQLELPKYAGRPRECTSFSFTVIVCEPYLEQRPVSYSCGGALPGQGRTRSVSQAPTLRLRLRNEGQWVFPWKLVAHTRSSTTWIHNARKNANKKEVTSLALPMALIVDVDASYVKRFD